MDKKIKKQKNYRRENPFLKKLIYLCLLFFSINTMAQRQALLDSNVAVFYPPGFSAEQHLPSLALVEEPGEMGGLPENWQIQVQFDTLFGSSMAYIPVGEKDDLYGSGEVKGNLKRNGTSIELWNTDNVVYSKFSGRRLYQSHPWVLGVRPDGSAYGILADNTWRMELTLGNGIWFSSVSSPFRVIVIDKDSPQEVLKSLADLIGRIEMPPLWSLGFQQSRWSYYPDARVKEIADTFRLKKLPCDVIWMDIDYMDQFKVFTFDPVKFPDPEGLNSYLHQKGFKAVWMIDPGVKAEEGYPVYDSGTEKGVWVKDENNNNYIGEVWPGECVFPDYTMPETREWWAGLYKDFMATGIDGVWNDMNEPAVFTQLGTMPNTNIHRGGGSLPGATHDRYHNVYGMLMVKASLQGIKEANKDKRPFLLTRSNFLGGHRYAATWTGDNAATWEMMKMSVPMSINLGLSGQPFSGPDIGGFGGNATPGLFAHWMGLGTFYPFSRAHSMRGSDNQEPWSFGEEVEEVSRMALERRYRLLPYLYTSFYEAHNTGIPVMQPAFFADIKDKRLRKEQQAFLCGNDLYIVPKWAEEPRIPKGEWQSVSLLDNPKESSEYLPDVLIRPGAIVPLGNIIQNTTEYSVENLTLLVSLDENNLAMGRLFHDNTEGYGYKEGDYALISFKAQKSGKKVTITTSTEGDFKLPKMHLKVHLITKEGLVKAKGVFGQEITVKVE
jgi:alpha-glucosidase